MCTLEFPEMMQQLFSCSLQFHMRGEAFLYLYDTFGVLGDVGEDLFAFEAVFEEPNEGFFGSFVVHRFMGRSRF